MAKLGRPTKYKPEYCQELIDFAANAEPYYESPVETQAKDGSVTTEMKRHPNPPPFLQDFAKKLNVNPSTIYEWAKVHPDFSNAIKDYEEVFARFLQENGLMGHYNAAFAIFTAKNRMGWTDKLEKTVKDGDKLSRDDLEARIKELLGK